MPLPDFRADLLRWEDRIPHMYKDTKGFVTVGVGNLLRDWSVAAVLPFVVITDDMRTRAATSNEIRADFERVMKMPAGLKAKRYKVKGCPQLLTPAIDDLLVRRIAEFVGQLRKLYPKYDSFPAPAQKALMDMIFNMGLGNMNEKPKPKHGLASFVTMNGHINQDPPDWIAVSHECHRRDDDPDRQTLHDERNEWTKGKFLEAATLIGEANA